MALFDYNHDAVHGAPQYHWIIIVTIMQLIWIFMGHMDNQGQDRQLVSN